MKLTLDLDAGQIEVLTAAVDLATRTWALCSTGEVWTKLPEALAEFESKAATAAGLLGKIDAAVTVAEAGERRVK